MLLKGQNSNSDPFYCQLLWKAVTDDAVQWTVMLEINIYLFYLRHQDTGGGHRLSHTQQRILHISYSCKEEMLLRRTCQTHQTGHACLYYTMLPFCQFWSEGPYWSAKTPDVENQIQTECLHFSISSNTKRANSCTGKYMWCICVPETVKSGCKRCVWHVWCHIAEHVWPKHVSEHLLSVYKKSNQCWS